MVQDLKSQIRCYPVSYVLYSESRKHEAGNHREVSMFRMRDFMKADSFTTLENCALGLVLSTPYVPTSYEVPKGRSQFKLRTNNYYLNNYGRVYKKQGIESKYERSITDYYEGIIAFINYTWLQHKFITKSHKVKTAPTEWNFANGISFRSHQVLSNNELKKLYASGGIDVSCNEHLRCFDSISEAYSALPKLPATFLVIMESLDIVAFETYMSYIYSYVNDGNGWKAGEWVIIDPPEQQHFESARIDFGLYSENSTFKNGKLHMSLTGYGVACDSVCAVFDYYCDNSVVRMSEEKRTGNKRSGTSYSYGQIWQSVNSGAFLRGTMTEDYIAQQEDKKSTPIKIRRNVLCEPIAPLL